MVTRLYLWKNTLATSDLAWSYDSNWTANAGASGRIWATKTKMVDAFTSLSFKQGAITNPYNYAFIQAYTDPLQAQTIDGYVYGYFRTYIDSAGTFFPQCSIRIMNGVSSSRGNLVPITTPSTTQYATTLTNRAFPALSSWSGVDGYNLNAGVTAVEGDRLVIELGYCSTVGSTARTGYMETGTNSTSDLVANEIGTNQYCGWIEFSKNISFINGAEPRTLYGGTCSANSNNTSDNNFFRQSFHKTYSIPTTADSPSAGGIDSGLLIKSPPPIMMTAQQGMTIPQATPATTINIYRMMARDAANLNWVRWTASGTPDWSGTYAGQPLLAGSIIVL